jgi:ectoine hydroxylase-related dioxygenase (phytanoyl-CoA dioxygenase family)
MEGLFRDAKTQAVYDENGYVIVPFLNEAEVSSLREVYNDHFSGKVITGLYPTHSRDSLELSLRISDVIQNAFKRRNDELLNDYRFFIGHYMVKSNVESREFELHQDWSVVEEGKFNVAQIWCPLTDTYPENGGMFLIEKSHRFFNNWRSGSLFRFHYQVNEKTERHLTRLHIKAGDSWFVP